MVAGPLQSQPTIPLDQQHSFQTLVSRIPIGDMAASASAKEMQMGLAQRRHSTPVTPSQMSETLSYSSARLSDIADGRPRVPTLQQQQQPVGQKKIVRRKAVMPDDTSLSPVERALNGSASTPFLSQIVDIITPSDHPAGASALDEHRTRVSAASSQDIRSLIPRKQRSSLTDTVTSLSSGTGSGVSEAGSSSPSTPLKGTLEPSLLPHHEKSKQSGYGAEIASSQVRSRAHEREIARHAQNGGDPDAFGPFSPSHFVKLAVTQPEHQEDAATIGARAARQLAEAAQSQTSDAGRAEMMKQREASAAAALKPTAVTSEAPKVRKPQAVATMLSTISASPIKKTLGPPPPVLPKSADRPKSAPFNNLQSLPSSAPGATQPAAEATLKYPDGTENAVAGRSGNSLPTSERSPHVNADHRANKLVGMPNGLDGRTTATNVSEDDPEAQLAPACPMDREPEPDLQSMMTRRSSSTSSSAGEDDDDEDDDLIDGKAIEAFPLPSSLVATPVMQVGSPRVFGSQQNTPRATSINTTRADVYQPANRNTAETPTNGQEEWSMAEELEIRDRVFRAEMKRPSRADKVRRRAARKLFDVNRVPSRKDVYEASLLTVRDEYGNRIRFGSLFEGQPTVVLFIRHFWCSQCQDYVDDIVKVKPELLDQHKVRLIIVSNGSWKMIKPYKKLLGDKCPFPIYTDRGKFIYTALGMVLRTFNANKGEEVGKYIKHSLAASVVVGIVNGAKLPIKPPGDQLQLGGEFILGPGLNVQFAHRMKGTRDHEQIETVLGHLGIDLEESSATYEAFSSHGTPVLKIGTAPNSPLSNRYSNAVSISSNHFRNSKNSDHFDNSGSPNSLHMSSFGITSSSTGSKATPVRLRAKPAVNGKFSQGISSTQIASGIMPQLPTPPQHSPLRISITPSQTVSTFSLPDTATISGKTRNNTELSTTPTQERNGEFLTPKIELTPAANSPISSHMSRFSSSSSDDSSHVLSRISNTFKAARLRVTASNGSIRNSINMETGSLHSYQRE